MTDEEICILIEPDGTVRCLYTEEIDLRALGPLQVRRATSVEWDEDAQEWVATLVSTGEVLAHCRTRKDALEAEVRILTERIWEAGRIDGRR